MSLDVNLHRIVRCTTNHFTSEGEWCAAITFASSEGHVQLFVPPIVAEALAEAFRESMARHEAGRVAAYVARQRNAELPDETREVLKLKGMIE